jgi:hypothetical protein
MGEVKRQLIHAGISICSAFTNNVDVSKVSPRVESRGIRVSGFPFLRIQFHKERGNRSGPDSQARRDEETAQVLGMIFSAFWVFTNRNLQRVSSFQDRRKMNSSGEWRAY